MIRFGTIHGFRTARWAIGLSLGLAAFVCSCNPAERADTDQQNQIQMWLDTVPDLKPLNVSNAEIAELQKAHEAGMTDATAVSLIKIARGQHKPFADGQGVADLITAGSSEQTILELFRMDHLGLWAGQARAMRLEGLSDTIILAIARRNARGLPVLSGEKLGELKNAGASDAVILNMVESGTSEKEASAYIAQRERAAGGHSFVYQGRKKQG
jgi:hypothetical protein